MAALAYRDDKILARNLPLRSRRDRSRTRREAGRRSQVSPGYATGSEAQLAAEIRQFIHRYLDFSESFENVATHYVLLTWLYDAFNELPYLRLRGDYGSGRLASQTCFHGSGTRLIGDWTNKETNSNRIIWLAPLR